MSKIACVYSASTLGLESFLVEVEVDVGMGLPSFSIVGLPDKAIDESKERIRAAVKNSGLFFPQHRLTVNLAPADVKKEGPSFDLPMAIGILLAEKEIEKQPEFEHSLFIGELSLDGRLRHVNGVLPIALFAKERGYRRLYLPSVNALEASIVEGIEIMPIESLSELVKHLSAEKLIKPFVADRSKLLNEQIEEGLNFAFVSGQNHAKRALEIAAAGMHNILMSGPPGSGKTLLAKSFSTILPAIDNDELIDVMKIYSVAGMVDTSEGFNIKRPFRSPHHTTSSVAIVGGGSWPKPGEISLAHRGVLFLDEFPEFPKSVLEALRQPLEDGTVTVSRASGSLTFPAKFLLVAAQNPCPCGYLSDPEKNCVCSPMQIQKYRKKVSGPILDRIDIHIEVPRVKYEKLASNQMAEDSSAVKARVQKARDVQGERFKKLKMKTNAEMGVKEIKEFCVLDEEAKKLVGHAVDSMKLSGRVYHRILKLSRTIADLSGSEMITSGHIAEALQYRPKESMY